MGLISLVGVLLTLAPAMLMSQAAWTVALLVPAVFCIGLPIGCGYAAVQLIFPNQARALVSAIVIFAVALIGLGFGSGLPGWLNDHLFHDKNRVGSSISITVALAACIGIGVLLQRSRHTGTTTGALRGRSPVRRLRVPEQRLEPVIHVRLDVAMEEAESWLIGRQVD